MEPTSLAAIDHALDELNSAKSRWVKTGIPQRIALIEQIQRDLEAVLPRWIDASLRAKGLSAADPAAGDEWGSITIIFRLLRQLKRTLKDIQRYGSPQLPGPVTARSDGQLVARVFPPNVIDRVLFMGISADTWLEPGVNFDELYRTQAAIYRAEAETHDGRIALVLGAGNISSLTPMDFIHKLFQENQVVILKMNPVNAYLGPLIEEGFAALVKPGFLRVVYGSTDEAAYMINHPLVDELHLTGSDKTYDAIVFGTGAEGARRKALRQPLLTKRFTAELGNLTPVIVVPGPWTAADIQYQAENIATMLVTNAGFNCVTVRLVVQPSGWEQRHDLNTAISQVLAQTPTRKAYYPGAFERHEAFVTAYPQAQLHGDTAGGHLPWTFIPDVDPANPDELSFNTEAFCGLFAETALDAPDVAAYLDQAVDFINEQVWGTLTASILVHPRSLQDPAVATAVERALGRLRYGTIGLNFWGVAGIFLGQIPWGAYAGSEPHDIQSGSGFVNNGFMLARPQKTVVRSPFRTPLIPNSISNPRFHRFMQALTYYEANGSLLRLPPLVYHLLAGMVEHKLRRH